SMPEMRSKELIGISSYSRNQSETEDDHQVTYDLGELGIYDLLDLYRRVLIHRETRGPLEIQSKHLSLGDVIREILSRWLPRGARKFFVSLLPESFTEHQVVMTFLALLELARGERVILTQSDPYEQLGIERLR
ncbi:hypothetical protein KAU08_03030, partial [bacterium]|nr:hypothetical protein [bacterium]